MCIPGVGLKEHERRWLKNTKPGVVEVIMCEGKGREVGLWGLQKGVKIGQD